jgi:hypothetical protein
MKGSDHVPHGVFDDLTPGTFQNIFSLSKRV